MAVCGRGTALWWPRHTRAREICGYFMGKALLHSLGQSHDALLALHPIPTHTHTHTLSLSLSLSLSHKFFHAFTQHLARLQPRKTKHLRRPGYAPQSVSLNPWLTASRLFYGEESGDDKHTRGSNVTLEWLCVTPVISKKISLVQWNVSHVSCWSLVFLPFWRFPWILRPL